MNLATSKPQSDTQPNPDAHSSAKVIVERLLKLPDREPFSAAEFIQQYPELDQYRSCVLDLVYEEFCRRREQGTPVQPSVFARQYPAVEQSFFRVLEFDQILQAHPSLVDHVPDEHWPREGEEFCGFELVEQIGRGAMSRVFVAQQPGLGMRTVVVKVCARGQREADLLARLEHRSIAPIHSIHKDAETGLSTICMPYQTRVTMHQLAEWLLAAEIRRDDDAATEDTSTRSTAHLRGADVRSEIQRLNDDPRLVPDTDENAFGGRYSVQDTDSLGTVILKWGVQLATALAHAHQKDVLHCDVKPGNVLLLQNLSASLLDFNLASSTEDAAGLAGGTLPYMAPEQLQFLIRAELDQESSNGDDAGDIGGQLPGLSYDESLREEFRSDCGDWPAASEQTDVFGLSATLWHMATGEPPFGVGVDSPLRCMAALSVLEQQRTGVSEDGLLRVQQVLPAPFVAVLQKGLAVNPAERHIDATDFANELKAVLESELQSAAPEAPRRRRRVLSYAVPVALSVCAIGAVNFLQNASGPTRQRGHLPLMDMHPQERTSTLAPVQSAREMIHRGDLHEAMEVLTPWLDSDIGARFLDLYCRTRLLPSMMLRKESAEVDPSLTGIVVKWQAVRDEWLHLSEQELFQSEADINLAYVCMEFGTKSSFEVARKHIDRAAGHGLSDDSVTQLQSLLHAVVDSDPTFVLNLSDDVRSVILNRGTRGEMLAYVKLLAHGLEPARPELRPQVELRLREFLSTVCSTSGLRIEPHALSPLVHPTLKMDPVLKDRVFANFVTQTSTPPENRLGAVLRLPLASDLDNEHSVVSLDTQL
ncbi:serine/threonine-protein kinase [Fuerstiella marisgermanici]|uniref:Serine/threonine-protein kinase PknH n=1 Tax=Fuerstiella marisgermanici TaxID=1891926 RepID=A0A1P8WFG6_9PLAN|nr:serine/threonine-protein kinase [Fuerstiella marisgermanici]APZ92809.1 Serine/threonine-protein kinase PknH [Fuerstiella marisgermanici]